MNLSPENKRSLELYLDTVSELERSSLYRNILEKNNITYRFQVKEGLPITQEVVDLDEEHLKAFILTARLLAQDNDGRSIRVVSNIVDESFQAHPSYLKFNSARWKLNDYLDGEYPALVQGESITSRELFDVFLYGHYAHRNPQKEQRFIQWQSNWVTFPHYKLGFLMSLSVLFSCAHEMRTAIEEMLK